MNTTRYLHHEVDRRTPNATYAQPRWIPASLLLDANMCNTTRYFICNYLTCWFSENSRQQKTKFHCGMAAVKLKDLLSVRLCCEV